MVKEGSPYFFSDSFFFSDGKREQTQPNKWKAAAEKSHILRGDIYTPTDGNNNIFYLLSKRRGLYAQSAETVKPHVISLTPNTVVAGEVKAFHLSTIDTITIGKLGITQKLGRTVPTIASASMFVHPDSIEFPEAEKPTTIPLFEGQTIVVGGMNDSGKEPTKKIEVTTAEVPVEERNGRKGESQVVTVVSVKGLSAIQSVFKVLPGGILAIEDIAGGGGIVETLLSPAGTFVGSVKKEYIRPQMV